ncbi:MAG: hypothetical protein WC792_02810 [Candidatus Micrarchaeia archaeon]|jgi:hypothetical protein
MDKKRGQAAIFDGITFLLLASFSASMVFFFLSTYGNSQERTLGNAHVLNFMLASFKAVYSVEASALYKVHLPEDGAKDCLTSTSCACYALKEWRGVSVSDVLKKDLRDGGLNDSYGMAQSPGLTALRCGTASVFKEFSDAGYSYFIEVENVRNRELVMPKGQNVTSDPLIKTQRECHGNVLADPFVVSTPFRVFKCAGSGAAGSCTSEDYVLRGCLWQTQRLTA